VIVSCYENSYQLKNIFNDFEYFIACINYNEEHNDGWKSSISPKLKILNHTILRIFQKSTMN
jgi:hypothetical protein